MIWKRPEICTRYQPFVFWLGRDQAWLPHASSEVSRIQVTACTSSVTLGLTPHSLWTPSSECRPIIYIFFTAFFHSNHCCDVTGSWPKNLCIRGLLQWISEVKFSRMKVRLPCVGKHNSQDIRNSVLHHVSVSVNKFYITCELPTGNLASYSATLQESGITN